MGSAVGGDRCTSHKQQTHNVPTCGRHQRLHPEMSKLIVDCHQRNIEVEPSIVYNTNIDSGTWLRRNGRHLTKSREEPLVCARHIVDEVPSAPPPPSLSKPRTDRTLLDLRSAPRHLVVQLNHQCDFRTTFELRMYGIGGDGKCNININWLRLYGQSHKLWRQLQK